MPQSSADEGAVRAGSTAPSPSQQSADPALAASGDVLLAAVAPTDLLDGGNSIDPNVTDGAEHAAAATPVVIVDSDGADVPTALAEANEDSSGFHFAVSPDSFLFNLDDDGSASLIIAAAASPEDQTVVDLANTDAASELVPTKLAGLFESADGVTIDGPDHSLGSGGYLASETSALYPNQTSTLGPDNPSIITAPIFSDASPSSASPIPAWIIEGGHAGGSSGSSGGTTGTASIINQASGGLVIDVVYDASVSNAPAGFTADVQAVVNYFESHFSNPITITIDVGYGEVDGQSLGFGALGESETVLTSVSYSALEAALVNNANAIGDAAAAASIPTTSPVSGNWWLSTAEAQALGLSSTGGGPDGYVGFSSSVPFAYNDSNGVPLGEYDFFGVVAHEISEVMGRQMMDGENFAGGTSYEPLDLFHYSAAGVRDFSGTTAGYFSPDGGTTNLGNFNTDPSGDFGDWAGSVGNDSFLAFTNSGVVNPITANDLAEMNVLGWDPATSGGAPLVTIALADDTSGGNDVTANDALTGTADANATVTISEGSTVLGTTTANASGVWSFTPTGLAQGLQTVTASETNAAGLTGSSSLTFTYDTTAPTVTIALVDDTSGGKDITSNDALTGTADPNATLTISEGSTVLGAATANASGVWSFTPTGLAQGLQTVTASETNAAGLIGSSSLTFTYETTPKVMIKLADDTSGGKNVTSYDALTGTADPNATLTISEGSAVLGTTTANGSGIWSFTPTGLAQGLQTVTASETNAAGLTGSSSLTFTYETTAPKVTIALVDDTSGGKNITSSDALTGTADANATVKISEGSTVLGTTTANASGVWSFTPTALAQGLQTITASETNAAGLTGYSYLTLTYETTAPKVTIALADDTSGGKDITSNDALTGTADANATVAISEGSTVLGTTTANASGVWSFTPTALAQGLQTITASETNSAGVTGSSSLTFTYDTTGAPTVTIALADDTSGGKNITSNDALTGTADPNATVKISEGSTVLGSATANGSGVWSFTPIGLSQGLQTITASETNAAGLAGSSSLTFTYETTAPKVTIKLADDTSGGKNITSYDALTGTADAGATVKLSEGSTGLGITTANASGIWSFTPTGLAQGLQTITASETNAAGLTGSSSLTFTYETTAPKVTIQLADDTSGGKNVTSNDALTGTADPNAVVKISEGSTVLGTTTANASGVWSFTPTGLAQGLQTISASETNAAGLTGYSYLTFTFETSTPSIAAETMSGSAISAGTALLTAGQTVQLAIGLTEAVSVSGGTPSLMLNDGSAATYDAAHSTATSLVFDYTVAAGQYVNALAVTSISLNGAKVTDAAGNAANFAGVNTTFANVSVDATAPVVTGQHAHSLLSGSVSVSASSGVLAGASDSNPSDVLAVSAVDGSSANVGHSISGSYGTLTMNPDGSYTYSNTNPGAVTAAGGVTEDLFNYTVSNGHGGTANATLAVLITSPNDVYKTGAAGSTLTGGSGNYVLDGSAGNMHLTAGNQGQQWLVGGAGDVLTGGKSTDTFMFAPGFGKETINSFNPTHDVIDLPQSMFANFAAIQADMHTSGASTLIEVDPNDVLTLTHVSITSLHASNFHFLV